MKLFTVFTLRIDDKLLKKNVPSMTKYAINLPDWPWLFGVLAGGQLVLHHFHQGDPEPNTFHSHEFDFWTFPLSPYRERVLDPDTGLVSSRIVEAFRLHKRIGSVLHQVEGRYHAGKYGQGVANKYEDFLTIGAHKKQSRNLDLARFEHPEGLSYDEFVARKPRASPKPFWEENVFYFKEDEEWYVGQLFPDRRSSAKLSEHYPYEERE